MKRDMNLVRDIMLEIEDCSSIDGDPLQVSDLARVGTEYDSDDILGHCELLIERGFVKGTILTTWEGSDGLIESLTWDGTEFLDKIRRKTVWEKTKERIGSSSVPLSVIERVSGEILMKMFTDE